MSSAFHIFPKESISKIMKKLFLFLLKTSTFLSYSMFCRVFFLFFPHFPYLKGRTKKGTFVNLFCNSKRLVTSSRFFLFFIILSIKRDRVQMKKSSYLFHGLFENNLFSSLLHAWAVLGYLRKLKRGMGLVFTADFLHTFFMEMFLIKYSFK